jgi:tRNA-modifying protein YgfZ
MNRLAAGPEVAAAAAPDRFDHAAFCVLAPLGVIRVNGSDAGAFLQGQFTNDVSSLDLGGSQYSAWCSPKGRMLANFVIVRAQTSAYELFLDASLAATIRKRLAMFVLRSKVVVEDAADASVHFGVGGREAAVALERALGAAPQLHRSATLDGFRVLSLPSARYVVSADPARADAVRQRLESGMRRVDPQYWQQLTILAGVPVITAATTDMFVPQTANWDVLGGINFQKGCYAGQEIVARTQYLGRLKERLFLAHTDVADLAPGDRLYSGAFAEQPSGTVVNAVKARDGGVDFLAVLQLASATSGDIHVGSIAGPVAALLNLPYSIPEPAAPRGRIA